MCTRVANQICYRSCLATSLMLSFPVPLVSPVPPVPPVPPVKINSFSELQFCDARAWEEVAKNGDVLVAQFAAAADDLRVLNEAGSGAAWAELTLQLGCLEVGLPSRITNLKLEQKTSDLVGCNLFAGDAEVLSRIEKYTTDPMFADHRASSSPIALELLRFVCLVGLHEMGVAMAEEMDVAYDTTFTNDVRWLFRHIAPLLKIPKHFVDPPAPVVGAGKTLTAGWTDLFAGAKIAGALPYVQAWDGTRT